MILFRGCEAGPMSAAAAITSVLSVLTGPGTPFELGDVDVNGRTFRGYVNAPPATRDLWLGSSAEDDEDYLIYEDERISYGDARRRVAEVANALVDDFGVAPGASVGIAMRNYPEWILSFWAIQMAGGTAVEMNSFWSGEELTYGVEDSGSTVLICDQERHDDLAPHIAEIRDRGIDLRLVVVRPTGELVEGAVRWEEVSGSADVPEVVIHPDDRSAIVYTSGTTAFPKGVVHSQRNVVTNHLNLVCNTVALRMAEAAVAGEDPAAAMANAAEKRTTMLVAVPLFHVTGSHCVMIPMTATGARLVLMYKWDAGKALELIERESVTSFTGVPTMTMDMLASPDFERRDTSSLQAMSSGGAPNPPHMVAKVNTEIPSSQAAVGYGLSEVAGIATTNAGIFYAEKPASVGFQPPVSEMRVVDELGNDVPAGERGELLIRGPHVFVEYHNKPEETAQCKDADGWFHTGDIAILDDDGFVSIVDRAKDVIIRGGENVGSAEIEAAVAHFPGVHECAAFGVPHERLGEEVAVAIYPIEGQTVDVEALQAHVGEHLAAFKVPTRVFIHDEPLPKNANGKILKRRLREQAQA
jgi:acyl-CoA synthetase (AMP-forming)/AMP-acid ligase II